MDHGPSDVAPVDVAGTRAKPLSRGLLGHHPRAEDRSLPSGPSRPPHPRDPEQVRGPAGSYRSWWKAMARRIGDRPDAGEPPAAVLSDPGRDGTGRPRSGEAPWPPVVLRHPTVADAGHLWRIAKECHSVDLSVSYAYLLWCRGFARTSLVAEEDGAVVGFVLGHRRPDAPGVLLVWQVAVAARARGRGIAAGLVDGLIDAVELCTAVETSIRDDDQAMQRLFRSVAGARGAQLVLSPAPGTAALPDGHDAERLHRITRLRRPCSPVLHACP
ncbi:diaminobutyrate acetyltransferase [Kocuria sp. U4B]